VPFLQQKSTFALVKQLQDSIQKQKNEYEELQRQKGASDALAESAAKTVRDLKAQVR